MAKYRWREMGRITAEDAEVETDRLFEEEMGISEQICEECGKVFKPQRSSPNNPPRYCSLKCYGHRCSRTNIGTNNSNWRGGMARFWERVDKSGDCWLWTGRRSQDGYGQFDISSRQQVGAHRLAYELTHGSVPDDLFVCHHCDNPPCCNPDHLFVGTHADNMYDMKTKGRHRSAPLFGMQNPRSKLTDNQVQEIRTLYATKQYTQKELAAMFGVTQGNIHHITSGKTRKHT